MCVVTLSDKLTARVLTRLLFSALLILIVEFAERTDLKLPPPSPQCTSARAGHSPQREASC